MQGLGFEIGRAIGINNQVKTNPDKCHSICSTDDKVNVAAENQKIFSSPCEKTLGVRLDSNLIFSPHINDICNKAKSTISRF